MTLKINDRKFLQVSSVLVEIPVCRFGLRVREEEKEHKATSQNITAPQVDFFIISKTLDSFKETIEWVVELWTYGNGKENQIQNLPFKLTLGIKLNEALVGVAESNT